jgi:hypothetical protein
VSRPWLLGCRAGADDPGDNAIKCESPGWLLLRRLGPAAAGWSRSGGVDRFLVWVPVLLSDWRVPSGRRSPICCLLRTALRLSRLRSTIPRHAAPATSREVPRSSAAERTARARIWSESLRGTLQSRGTCGLRSRKPAPRPRRGGHDDWALMRLRDSDRVAEGIAQHADGRYGDVIERVDDLATRALGAGTLPNGGVLAAAISPAPSRSSHRRNRSN